MFASLAVSLLLLALPQAGESNEVWISANEVWIQTASRQLQLTHDKTAKRLAALAPKGDRIVYVVDRWESDPEHKQAPEQDVVEISVAGELLRHLVCDGYVPKPFDRVEWIDNQRVGAMSCGHANCVYWVLDANTGKTVQVLSGGFDFVWSHNRQWVARRFVNYADIPEGDLSQTEVDHLALNEAWMYPPREEVEEYPQSRVARKPFHAHEFGPFTWSPRDVWLGFTETVMPEGDPYVVLVSPDGKVLRDTLPVDVQYYAIDWIDDTHFRVAASGRTFAYAVEGNELRELASSE